MFEATPDRWLAAVLGRSVQRVSGTISPGEKDENVNLLRTVAAAPGFAYARVPASEVFSAQLLEDAGFRLVDSSVTLETGKIDVATPATACARMARGGDAAAVEHIARSAFHYSRFHLDPRIPKQLADEIKAQWAGNFFRGGRGDYMVVAEHEGAIAGFLQLLAGADGTLTIDLIAVAEGRRGRGLASGMIGFAARACGRPTRIRVGTQAANIASLRLYERLGFTVSATGYVFHCHGPAA